MVEFQSQNVTAPVLEWFDPLYLGLVDSYGVGRLWEGRKVRKVLKRHFQTFFERRQVKNDLFLFHLRCCLIHWVSGVFCPQVDVRSFPGFVCLVAYSRFSKGNNVLVIALLAVQWCRNAPENGPHAVERYDDDGGGDDDEGFGEWWVVIVTLMASKDTML